ncbi:MAG: efflux RND transporter periplasmic adaptor subunit [Chitinophagales bacterium]|nr:efflux RND transporter periplasmic adaptor subunit [Chitinophagales bacterium]
MKRSLLLLFISTTILAACGGDDGKGKNDAELVKLKKERASLDEKIAKLEAEVNKNKPGKATAVSIMVATPQQFNSFVEVQANVNGDQSVTAMPQAPGTVQSILVHTGQKVSKGQTLAILEAAAVEQQIKAAEVQLILAKQVYEKNQRLWAQNIGSEVNLLTTKATYEAAAKQKEALIAQRNMYKIISPVSGTVDLIDIKVGDPLNPAMKPAGIRVVNFDALKIQANLGENYLGKVQEGNPVNLIFADTKDTMKTKLTYVSKAVDPVSRAFQVEIRLGNNNKLHPNMSCKMQIANYQNSKAIVVPVSVIQNTAEGALLYIADGNKAKAVMVKTGHNSNGMVEVLEGLNEGDRVITAGYADLDNGDLINVE